jgi:hypothetical protein
MDIGIKKQVYGVGVIGLILAVGGYILLGRVGSAEYKIREFDRNEVCSRRLTMYYKEAGKVGLGMEEPIYSKAEADRYLKKVQSDIKTIEKAFVAARAHGIQVYIIQIPVESGIYVGENTVYCTIEELETDSYRTKLVRSLYGLTDPAMIHGLEGYVFGESADVNALKKYYSEAEDISVLSLFGARFYEAWNTEEEIELAKETAVGLVGYLIGQDKSDLILSQTVSMDEKNEWLKSMGVNRTYENPYELPFVPFTFGKSKEHSLIIDSNQAKYYMSSVVQFSTAKEVEEFVYKDYDGRNYILNYLKENAPNQFEYFHIDTKPQYFISNKFRKVGGVARPGGKVELAMHTVHLHEYIHVLTGGNRGASKYWMEEGLAEYLSWVIYPDNYMVKIDFMNATAESLPDSSEYYVKSMNYYKENGGEFGTGNINARLYADACAYGVLNSKENLPSNAQSIGSAYGLDERYRGNGNELTYTQACSFAAYLVDKFSLDDYLAYHIGEKKNQRFEDAFGVSYQEAKQEWLDYLYNRRER